MQFLLSNSKVIFLNFCIRKYFLLFFAEFKLLMFQNIIVKIWEKLDQRNLLKNGTETVQQQDSSPTKLRAVRTYIWR